MAMDTSTISRTVAALLVAGAAVGGGVVLAPAASAAPAVAAAAAPAAGTRHLTAAVPLPVGFQPEGIASIGHTFFSGSLADGRIWRGDLLSGKGRVLVPGVAGRSLRGM